MPHETIRFHENECPVQLILIQEEGGNDFVLLNESGKYLTSSYEGDAHLTVVAVAEDGTRVIGRERCSLSSVVEPILLKAVFDSRRNAAIIAKAKNKAIQDLWGYEADVLLEGENAPEEQEVLVDDAI